MGYMLSTIDVMLTCAPTKLTHTQGFVNLKSTNDSCSSDRWMLIQWTCCFFNL